MTKIARVLALPAALVVASLVTVAVTRAATDTQAPAPAVAGDHVLRVKVWSQSHPDRYNVFVYSTPDKQVRMFASKADCEAAIKGMDKMLAAISDPDPAVTVPEAPEADDGVRTDILQLLMMVMMRVQDQAIGAKAWCDPAGSQI